jgi:hypothetical protein
MKIKALFFSVFLAFAFAGPTVAFGQAKEKVTESYDLGSESLDGELMGPDGDFMSGRKISILNSLIQFRDHFIIEMIMSAEDL